MCLKVLQYQPKDNLTKRTDVLCIPFKDLSKQELPQSRCLPMLRELDLPLSLCPICLGKDTCAQTHSFIIIMFHMKQICQIKLCVFAHFLH